MPEQPLVMLAASSLVAGLALLFSSPRSPLWLLDPHGLLTVVLWLHVSGILLYFFIFGSYPTIFGLDPRLLPRATWMLISVQAGVGIGALVKYRASRTPVRQFGFSGPAVDNLLRWLTFSVLLSAAPSYVVALRNGLSGLAAGYGAAQWSAGEAPRWANLPAVTITSLAAVFLVRGAGNRPLFRVPVLLTALYALGPSVLSGGRRDVLFALLFFSVAVFFRLGAIRTRYLIALGAVAFALIWALVVSRSGSSLLPQDRLAAFEGAGEEQGGSIVANALTLHVGASVLTAAMTVFPAYYPHSEGRSYLEAATNVLFPRFITGFTPYVGSSVRFHDLYYSDVRGHGMDYSLAAEGYQNFGVGGPFLVALALGALLGATFGRAAGAGKVNYWLVLHAHVFGVAIWALRTDAHTTFKLLAYGCLWLAALAVLARRLPFSVRDLLPVRSTAGSPTAPRRRVRA